MRRLSPLRLRKLFAKMRHRSHATAPSCDVRRDWRMLVDCRSNYVSHDRLLGNMRAILPIPIRTHHVKKNLLERASCRRLGWLHLAGSRRRRAAQRSSTQLLQRPLCDKFSTVDDADMRAQPLNDLEHVRRKEDGHAARGHPLQHGLQRACRDCIHTLERLIQKQHPRSMDHRRGQRQLLLHAMRKVGD